MRKQQAKKTITATDKLFVFGLDNEGKPRGARFVEFNEKVVSGTAAINLTYVHPASAAFAEVGMKLPAGRLYASGKAFVPPIRRELLGKLEAVLAVPGDESEVHHQPPRESDVAVAPGLPRSWDSIEIGHVVLAPDDSPIEYGYWPCVVIKREDHVLTLRLRDYPNKGTYVRHIAQVALINPGPE
jgi:hypothetical protein